MARGGHNKTPENSLGASIESTHYRALKLGNFPV